MWHNEVDFQGKQTSRELQWLVGKVEYLPVAATAALAAGATTTVSSAGRHFLQITVKKDWKIFYWGYDWIHSLLDEFCTKDLSCYL